MKIAVVIRNWNGVQHLQHYLPRVVATTADADIVVADNGSNDGSVEWLHSEMPSVRRLLLGQNFGFAEGYNRAIAQVDADYIVLLNSDVEVTQGWLSTMLAYLDTHPEDQRALCLHRKYVKELKDLKLL